MTEHERFWAKVSKSEGCWLWTAAQAPNGYGTFFVGPGAKKAVRAHRYSWSLHFGPIPEGRIICHRCDVRLCVRPDHLFLGSNRDNNVDTLLKDRNAQALPREKVAAIMTSSGSTWEVAEAFNVSQRTAWRIQQARLFAERAGWLSPSDSKAMLEELEQLRKDSWSLGGAMLLEAKTKAEKERDELKAQLEELRCSNQSATRGLLPLERDLKAAREENSQLQARIKEFEEDRMSHGPCHMIHVEERDAEISQLQAQVAALRDFLADGAPDGMHRSNCKCLWHAEAKEAYDSTADAAKAYEARIVANVEARECQRWINELAKHGIHLRHNYSTERALSEGIAKIRAEERERCVRVATEALCLEGADCKELLCEAARVTIAIRTLGDAQK